jgi:hypothetical protein
MLKYTSISNNSNKFIKDTGKTNLNKCKSTKNAKPVFIPYNNCK